MWSVINVAEALGLRYDRLGTIEDLQEPIHFLELYLEGPYDKHYFRV